MTDLEERAQEVAEVLHGEGWLFDTEIVEELEWCDRPNELAAAIGRLLNEGFARKKVLPGIGANSSVKRKYKLTDDAINSGDNE